MVFDMGKCPHCDAEITVQAELVAPSEFNDDNVSMSEEEMIQLEQGARMYQYVYPECDIILGVGTHKWAR